MRSAKLVGTFQENVDSLVDRAQNGSKEIVFIIPSLLLKLHSDVVCKLSSISQIVLDIEIISSASELGAGAASLSEAKSNAAAAVEKLKSPPPIAEKAANHLATIDDGLGTANDISDTWNPLLEKVKIFSDLVDEIAEVRSLSFRLFVS